MTRSARSAVGVSTASSTTTLRTLSRAPRTMSPLARRNRSFSKTIRVSTSPEAARDSASLMLRPASRRPTPKLLASEATRSRAGSAPRAFSAQATFAAALIRSADRPAVPAMISGCLAAASDVATRAANSDACASTSAARGKAGSMAWAAANPTVARYSGEPLMQDSAMSSIPVDNIDALNSGLRS